MRSMKLVRAGILFTALSVINISAYAADLKIAVLDVQQILQKSPIVHRLNSDLQSKFKPRQDKLADTKKQLQSEITAYTKNQAVMKPEEQSKLKNKILADQAAFQSMGQEFTKDLDAERSKDMQSFMTNLKTAVDAVAKKDQYNLVLNRAAVPYLDANMDITQEVLDAMGK